MYEIHYPGGVTATYTYDFADRQQALEIQVGQNPGQPLVTSSSYLPSGPLTSLALGNGLTETRTFDGRYVPERIQVTLDPDERDRPFNPGRPGYRQSPL